MKLLKNVKKISELEEEKIHLTLTSQKYSQNGFLDLDPAQEIEEEQEEQQKKERLKGKIPQYPDLI